MEASHALGAARLEAGDDGVAGKAEAAALPSVEAAATGPHEGLQQPEPAAGMHSFYEAPQRATPQQPFLSQTVREAEGKGEGEAAAPAGTAPGGVGTGGGELGTEARWMQLGRSEVTRLGALLEAERTQLQRQLEHRHLEPEPEPEPPPSPSTSPEPYPSPSTPP